MSVITSLARNNITRRDILYYRQIESKIVGKRKKEKVELPGLYSFVVVSLSFPCYWLPWILVTAWKTALHPNPVLLVEVT
jgi:hypothetical protein